MTVRKNIDPEKKKNFKRKIENMTDKKNLKNYSVLSQEKLLPCLSLLKHKFPSAANKPIIEKMMKETFFNRRKWIEDESPVISVIMGEYPKLFDFEGDMVKKNNNK